MKFAIFFTLAAVASAQQAPNPDWARLARYAQDNAKLGAPGKDENRVVFMGDSITDAWGRRDSQFFPRKPYVNRGISGQTAPQMLVRFRQDVVDLHPAVVLILAGTNDVAGNTGPETPEAIQGYLLSMVDIARANGIEPVLCSIPPAADFPWKKGLEPAPKIEALNKWIKAYAAMHVIPYVDYHSALQDGKGGMKPEFSEDGVHPTKAGYEVMAPLAERGIAEALNNRRARLRRNVAGKPSSDK